MSRENTDTVLLPDAELQCQHLAAMLRDILSKSPIFIGIYSGGAWIAERLSKQLNIIEPVGFIDVSFYRDDYNEKGLHQQVKPSNIPSEINSRHVILVDDVLYTGRTTRAALNEIFDHGRPASVSLAVLADRGGRHLPIQADYCVWQFPLVSSEKLVLTEQHGKLKWNLQAT